MYLWRKSATPKWLINNENRLRPLADDQLAIIERPNRKRLRLEVAAKSRAKLERLATEFGGRIEKLSPDWLKRFLRRKTKPIKIGTRQLIIPAGAAFGTGEHATTAMSLRLLEKLDLKPDWSLVDLGTGSGILALAAKRLGAARAIGIDVDPMAISTAKQNARLNKIRGVQFQLADVRRWKSKRKIDIISANLFSELLVEILPRLKSARRLILSGILREQEIDVRRGLKRHKIDIVDVRRRGKWVAIVAASR
jgi:ribosomal protein L11 methyltransferase